MTQFGHRAPARVEQTIIRVVSRPDRRQLPTRRSVFRGGRRIEDAIEGLEGCPGVSGTVEESGEDQESAIVMGWASPRTGNRDTAAKI